MVKVIKSTELTLDKIFPSKTKDIDLGTKSEAGQDEDIRSAKKEIKKGIKGIPWFLILYMIKKQVGRVLNVNVMDIVQTGWKKMGIPKKPKAKDKKTDGKKQKDDAGDDEGFEQALSTHSIKFEYYPILNLILKKKTLSKLKLRVQGRISMKGAKLTSKNNKMKKVTCSEASGSISIKFKKSTLYSKTLTSIPLLRQIEIVDKNDKPDKNSGDEINDLKKEK